MHRTTFAAAKPRPATVDLVHHGSHVAALGDAVSVAAMCAGDVVPIFQMHAHADGAGFLACVEVHEAWDFAGREFDVEPFLKLADGPHGAVRSQQLITANLHVVSPRPIRGQERNFARCLNLIATDQAYPSERGAV